MYQLIMWLLLLICAAFSADASSLNKIDGSCITRTSTGVMTVVKPYIIVGVAAPNSTVSDIITTIVGVSTTLTWTEPVLSSTTTVSVLETTYIPVAEYYANTIINCPSFTSTIPGSTSYSTLPTSAMIPSTSPTASSSHLLTTQIVTSTQVVGGATSTITATLVEPVVSTSSAQLSTITYTTLETLSWTVGGSIGSSVYTIVGSVITTISSRLPEPSASTQTWTSTEVEPWTSTSGTSQATGTSFYIITGASVTTLSSSTDSGSSSGQATPTSAEPSSSSTGDLPVVPVVPVVVPATPVFPSDAPVDPTYTADPPGSSSSSSFSQTGPPASTSSSATPTPTANSTAPVVVPLYHAKLDNVTYYLPLCSDPTQTLWRPDGSNFTLSCTGITLAGGQVIPLIDKPPFGECAPSPVNADVCFSQRWNWTTTEEGRMTCQTHGSRQLFSRDTPGDLKRNLTAIADALAAVKNVAGQASSAAEHGLSSVGCAAQAGFERVAASYFKQVQAELGVVAEVWSIISDFFKTVLSLGSQVTTPVGYWIDDTDEQLQNLACYTTADGSAVWRTISKHSSFHQGLNTLNSLNNAIAVSGLIEKIMKAIFGGLVAEYEAYIQASGSIVQGWTQAMRMCTTKWDLDSLSKPEEQEPEEDDEDDWLPRYQIFTKPDATTAELKALEHALGNHGWEISSSTNSTDWIKGYVVDLNIMQALLPQTMPFISATYRHVWDGSSSTSIIQDDPSSTPARKRSQAVNSTQPNKLQERAFDPEGWTIPTGDQRLKLDNGHYLKTISQQKGQKLDDFADYTYADPQGEGSWIIVIDGGFDLKHKKLQSTEFRKVIHYVVPIEHSLPKLHQHEVDAGWTTSPAVIDDNLPDQEGYGHGTGVACVAGGLDTGVASRANLLLVKPESFFVNTITGEKRQPGLTMAALQDAFSAIRDASNNERMSFGKRVVSLSIVVAPNSGAASFFETWCRRQDMEGTVIVMAAGNFGYNYMTDTVPKYQAEQAPQKLATDSNGYIVVGGTYHDGSLWEWTTPGGARPGSAASGATISVWAQADDVYTCDANGASDAMRMREGTSFAAPQVAGLAAYMLSYPWPSPKESPFNFGAGPRDGTVGQRVKTMLCNTYAYQRLPASEIANKALKTLRAFPIPRDFPWAIPERVHVIYNMAFGPQRCKNVEGFPNVKRDGLSCPLPPGAGEPSSVSHVTESPTQYISSAWTGFSTATGTESTPPGVFITVSFTETVTMVTGSESTSASTVVTVWESQTISLTSGTETTTMWTEAPTSTHVEYEYLKALPATTFHTGTR